jgi:hypothetical protein
LHFDSDVINEKIQMHTMLRCFALRDLLKRQMINGTFNVGTRDGDIRFTISFSVRKSDRPTPKVSESLRVKTINGDTHSAKAHANDPQHYRVRAS